MRRAIKTTAAVFAVAVPFISISNAQTPAPKPSFEVASIKSSPSNGAGASITFSPGGGFTAKDASVKRLIRTAYRVLDSQVIGGPAWITFDKFDIQAKPEGIPSPDESRVMLQSLLEDRFRLKVHRITKEDTVYALAVGKGGPRFNGMADANSDQHHLTTGGGHIVAKNAEIAQFLSILTQILDHPVIDKTDLKGFLDFDFALPTNILPKADSSEPSIFEAIQDQLGLRLEQAKGPVELLVIDSVQKPSEN